MSQPAPLPSTPLYSFLRTSRAPSAATPPGSSPSPTQPHIPPPDPQLSARLLLASSQATTSLGRIENQLDGVRSSCETNSRSCSETCERVEASLETFSEVTAKMVRDGVLANLTTLIAPELASLRTESDTLRQSAASLASCTKTEVDRVLARQDQLDRALSLLNEQIHTLFTGLQPLLGLAPLVAHLVEQLGGRPSSAPGPFKAGQTTTPPPSPPRVDFTPSRRPTKRRRLIQSDTEDPPAPSS